MNFFRPSSFSMSVVGSRTTSGGPPAFLIFSGADAFGRKSATAAAITTTSTSAKRPRTASAISAADSTRTMSVTPGGAGRSTVVTRTTCAPRREAASATA